jgi:hypothetical protein
MLLEGGERSLTCAPRAALPRQQDLIEARRAPRSLHARQQRRNALLHSRRLAFESLFKDSL